MRQVQAWRAIQCVVSFRELALRSTVDTNGFQELASMATLLLLLLSTPHNCEQVSVDTVVTRFESLILSDVSYRDKGLLFVQLIHHAAQVKAL